MRSFPTLPIPRNRIQPLLTLTACNRLTNNIICTFVLYFKTKYDREQSTYAKIRHALWHIYGNILDFEIRPISPRFQNTIFNVITYRSEERSVGEEW